MGTFVAPNDRTIHPFPLENVYAKFIKVTIRGGAIERKEPPLFKGLQLHQK